MNKKGISLIVLAIMIVIILIITTVTVVQYNDSKDQAKISAFATDLEKIQEQTKLYFIENGSFPTYNDDQTSLNESQILGLVGTTNSVSFIAELTLNSEYNEDQTKGQFYKIDLSKIDIKATLAGIDPNSSDVYVVSYPSFNVYYLAGQEAKNNMYYSLSSKIVSDSKIQQKDGNTIEQVQSNISISKSINTWTNTMPININVNITGSQKVYLKLSGITGEKEVSSVVAGSNKLKFNLSDLLSSNKDLSGNSILTAALTQDEINSFNVTDNSLKNISILIKDGTSTIETEILGLSNYDVISPTISNKILTSGDNNTLKLTLSDSLSGVSKVKYDYIEKVNSDLTTSQYYSNTIDGEYVRQNGKEATLNSDRTYSIVLPKNVTKIYISVIDYAGNWIDYNNYVVE